MAEDRDVVVDHHVVEMLADLEVDVVPIEFREHVVVPAEDVEVTRAATPQDAPRPALAVQQDDPVQRDGGLSTQEHRVREVDVLVVALGEGDVEGGEEVTSVDLVAGDGQQVEGAANEVSSDPRFDAAESALEAGDWDAAVIAYQEILSASPADPIAKIGLLNVKLLKRTDGRDLAADINALTLETESVLRAADATFLMGEFADAFALLIEHIKNAVGADRDRTRERTLELFAIAGPADPAVIKARSALTNALF